MSKTSVFAETGGLRSPRGVSTMFGYMPTDVVLMKTRKSLKQQLIRATPEGRNLAAAAIELDRKTFGAGAVRLERSPSAP